MRTIKFNLTTDGTIDKMVKSDVQFDDYIDYRSNHFENYRNEHKDIYNFLYNSKPVFTGKNELLEQFLKTDNETLKKVKETCKKSNSLSYIMSKELIRQYEDILLNQFKELSEQAKQSKGSNTTLEQKEALKTALNKSKLKMKIAVRQASEQIENELKKASNIVKMLSVANAGSSSDITESKTDIETVLKLYEKIKNNPEIEKLIELIGKMQN